jgi:formate dehydrogenase major subunit
MNNRESGLEKVTGLNASPNTIDELLSTNFILKVGFIAEESRVIDLKIRQAEEAGAKVMSVCGCGGVCEEDACDLTTLKGIAKAIVESGKAKKVAGYDEFAASLEGVTVSEAAKAIADQYLAAKKAMIVYQQNFLTVDGATLVADIAMLSGHIGSPRDGILQVKSKNNSQGLIDMGITAGKEALEGVKALVVFGENADIDTDALEFLAVCDTHMTELAAKADVVIPGTGFASTSGTYTNTERRLQMVQACVDEGILFSNWEIAAEIANIFEVPCGWEDTDDISDEMADMVIPYRYAEIGDIIGGVLTPAETAKLVVVADGPVVEELPCTDSLMQMITDRLPKPVNPTA